jgi:hypothetical protein
MKNYSLSVLALAFAFGTVVQVRAQTVPATPDSDIVKISTKLVQVDLVVVDKDGNAVTNLSSRDFEILQDGKPQKITNFSFVKRRLDERLPTTKPVTGKGQSIFPPPVKFQRADVGRVITFILGAQSFSSRLRHAKESRNFFANRCCPTISSR